MQGNRCARHQALTRRMKEESLVTNLTDAAAAHAALRFSSSNQTCSAGAAIMHMHDYIIGMPVSCHGVQIAVPPRPASKHLQLPYLITMKLMDSWRPFILLILAGGIEKLQSKSCVRACGPTNTKEVALTRHGCMFIDMIK